MECLLPPLPLPPLKSQASEVARVPHPRSAKNESSSLSLGIQYKVARAGAAQEMGSNSEQGKATARQVQEGGRNEQQSRPPRLGTGREEGMRRARAGAGGRRTQLPQRGRRRENCNDGIDLSIFR